MSADIIAWLRGPEGEQWSRDRHESGTARSPVEIFREILAAPAPQWRATGPLGVGSDPCGSGPMASTSSKGTGERQS